jgi:hypothetical protein
MHGLWNARWPLSNGGSPLPGVSLRYYRLNPAFCDLIARPGEHCPQTKLCGLKVGKPMPSRESLDEDTGEEDVRDDNEIDEC